MGVPVLHRRRVETYLPDVTDNRAAAQAGAPALCVTIQRPTVWDWQEHHVARAQQVLRLREADPTAELSREAERGLEGILFATCVQRLWIGQRLPDGTWQEIGPLTIEDGTPIETGAVLWAMQGELDYDYASSLVADLRAAIFDRATFTAGTLAHLDWRSGSPSSMAQTDGIAATVVVGA